MTDETEHAYSQGADTAWRIMLQTCLRHLGLGGASPEQALALLAAYRATLRRLCVEFGNPDYPDNLHPDDVADKYLIPHLREGTDT